MEWTQKKNCIQTSLSGGVLSVSFPAGGGVRLQYGVQETESSWCPVLKREPLDEKCIGVCEKEEGVYAVGNDLEILIGNDGGLSIFRDGTAIWHTPAHAFALEEHAARMMFCMGKAEKIYGLGQDPMARLDQNGCERRMWNQWGGHERSGNCGIGFFTSDAGYGMLLNSAAAARFCFGDRTPELDPLGEAMAPSPFKTARRPAKGTAMIEIYGPLDIFIFFGCRQTLLSRYYDMTGLPGLLPKWAYGFLQSKNRYMNRDDLMTVARRLRKNRIPCDGLIIDWLWFSEFGDLEWDEQDWPDAARMLEQLQKDGFHVVSAQHPFISERCKYYGFYKEKGYLNRVPAGKRITYDHTNPEARTYWWEKTAKLYRQGLRGYWTDMGELEEHFEGTQSCAGGRTKTHNAYSLLWAQGLHDGQRKEFGTRAFILSRSGCAGIQRYGAVLWSGDISSSWQVLRDQIVIGQEMSMSGQPWWCTDIGGFLSGRECTPELYIRWMEWGVFCSVFRTHGTRPGNEPWSFGEAAQKYIRELIRLRYRLLPYVYSLAMDCALHGVPIVRPMAWEYPDDLEAAACEGQFFFGPSLLAAPVTKMGARTQRVYLPAGTWLHWWSGEKYNSGWHTVPAPLGRIPLFVRSGSIIPVFAHIGRNARECGGLTLLTVPEANGPDEDGAFDYYDDDGDGFAFETGGYTHVRFRRRKDEVFAETLHGTVPQYTVLSFTPQSSGSPFTVDCSWRGGNAVITLTLLKEEGPLYARLEPESGWQITSCTAAGARSPDIFEQNYFSCWKGPVKGKPGDTVRWQLIHTACARRVGIQKARLQLTGPDGTEETAEVKWDGAYLSSPWMLGCFDPVGTNPIETVYPPEENPDMPFYEFNGILYHWQHDAEFERNPYGYVDFRRFGVKRDGEAMSGVGYAREILYSKTDCKVSFVLRYDSPIVIWLNGEKMYTGKKRNAPEIYISLALKEGKNMLLLKQAADVSRPYSGGEFGYSLRLDGKAEIYSIKA